MIHKINVYIYHEYHKYYILLFIITQKPFIIYYKIQVIENSVI